LDGLVISTAEPGILAPSWNLTYTGNRSVVQEVMYQFSQDNVWWDGAWHVVDTNRLPAETDVNGTYSSRLDLGNQEGWYRIRVSAREDVAEGASDEVTNTGVIRVNTGNRAYIKIG
jgi:hypothetical protein